MGWERECGAGPGRDRKKGEYALTLRLAGDGDVVVHYVVIPGAPLITSPRVDGGGAYFQKMDYEALCLPPTLQLRPPLFHMLRFCL